MITTFHINTRELNEGFINALKQLFSNQQIKVTVESEMDETEFIKAVKANSEMINKSIKEFQLGDVVTVNLNDLK